MRKYWLLLFVLAVAVLRGVPVARTILNSSCSHASFSETRCVTAYPNDWDHDTVPTHITLWDISDPQYPRVGKTIFYQDLYWYEPLRQPTVYGNLLLFMDDYYLRVLDITNIYTPVQLSQLQLGQANCFVLYSHYVVLGRNNGEISIYDFTNPSQLTWVGNSACLPNIWMMWVSDDKLGISCGNFSSHTAKLFGFSEASLSFYELASVDNDFKLEYVGAWNGRMLTKREGGGVRIYDYAQGGTPILVHVLPPDNTLRVLCDNSRLISLSADNCVFVWEEGQDGAPAVCAHYDLSHLGLESGSLFELRGDRLCFRVDTVLCFILDLSDLSEAPELACNYPGSSEISSIAIPEGKPLIYYPRGDTLACLKLDSSGLLSEGRDFTPPGTTFQVYSQGQNLYLDSVVESAIQISAFGWQDPEHPHLISSFTTPDNYHFSVKQDCLYVGAQTNIAKYNLGENGIPVRERMLSYTVPEANLPVYFLDVASRGGNDYGVGICGSLFSGYHPILVYWLQGGVSGYLLPANYLYKAYTLGDCLYLTGRGISILDISGGVPRPFHEIDVSNHTRGVTASILRDERWLLECYKLSNQIRIYDLLNPRYPQLLYTLNQSHSAASLALAGNKLIAANGRHGVAVYNLPFPLQNQGEYSPAPGMLNAFPNPFGSNLELSFTLKRPSPATVECFNLRGQRVFRQTLPDAKAGENLAHWDGRDEQDRECAPGVYVLKVTSSEGVLSRKVTKLF